MKMLYYPAGTVSNQWLYPGGVVCNTLYCPIILIVVVKKQCNNDHILAAISYKHAPLAPFTVWNNLKKWVQFCKSNGIYCLHTKPPLPTVE